MLSIGDAEQFWPAQDLGSLGGKLLRINPDGSAPEDNPFYEGPDDARSKIWSLGLRNPVRFAQTPTSVRAFAPKLGEDSDQVLAELGYSAEEIEKLRQSQAVG